MIDFTQNPLRSRAPITPSNGIPSNSEGADGDVKQDITTGVLWIKEPGTGWVTLMTPSQASSSFPQGVNQKGLNVSSGAYGSYPNTSFVVAASALPSYTNKTYSFTPVDSIGIPANVVGPDGWLELYIHWVCNNSANAKGVHITFDSTDSTWSDSLTTNTSSEVLIRISNRNDGKTQLSSGSTLAGQNAAAEQFLTMDMSVDHHIALWTTLANVSGSDAVRIERWSLTAHNPPSYSTKRAEQGTKMFYGANGHYDDGASYAQIIADMKTMGFKLFRATIENPSSLTWLQGLAQAFKTDNTGLQLYCCMDIQVRDGSNNLWTSEAAAYAYGFQQGVAAVQALAPYGVKIFECGNERDQSGDIIVSGKQGGYLTDFINSGFVLLRGIMRGAIDGIHTYPGCLAASNAFTQCGVGAMYGLWNGQQPDGTSGWPLCRWDISAFHNYEDYGPLMAVQMDPGSPYCNVFEYLNRNFGVPIVISEWNAKQSDTDPQRAAWASRFMYEAYNNRYKYNIAAIIVYEMYGGPWNVMNSTTAGTVQSTFGTTVQSFIGSNPDSGT